jgi:predicted nucleic acid-binding protein
METAKKLWLSAVDLFRMQESTADLLLTLELTNRYRISAYDAQYLAIAVRSGLKLVTEAKALRQSAPQYCTTIGEFLELHDRALDDE